MEVEEPIYYVAIEGPMGIGKSSLCAELSSQLSIPVAEEPVVGNPYLELFYSDQKKYAYPLQLFMLCDRHKAHLKAYEANQPYIVDNSMLGDRVYATLHRKYGNINEHDWQVYDHFYKMATKDAAPSLIVYLSAHVDVIMERITKRGREMEQSTVSREYVTDLIQHHEEQITGVLNKNHPWCGTRILCVDWSANLDNLKTVTSKLIDEMAKHEPRIKANQHE